MLDLGHIPQPYGNGDVQFFTGNASAVGVGWQTWVKPRGKSMLHIMLVGAGGNGGTGVVGANSTAGGGAGGQSGAITNIIVPLAFVPDVLFYSGAGRKPTATANFASIIAVTPVNTANNILVFANGGLHGGNASAGTGGTVGTAAAIATAANMPLGWPFITSVCFASQVGTAGGAAVTAANLTLPVTGAFVTGGTGGGGLPAAAATGTNGGSITGAGVFPTVLGGTGSATATVPAQAGNPGFQPIPKLGYLYGGTGAASTHGTATGGGLVQGSGGDGSPGCGGGGMGGALTASTAGVVGMGGASFAIFTCW